LPHVSDPASAASAPVVSVPREPVFSGPTGRTLPACPVRAHPTAASVPMVAASYPEDGAGGTYAPPDAEAFGACGPQAPLYGGGGTRAPNEGARVWG